MPSVGSNEAIETKTEHTPAWVRAHGDVLSVASERAGLEHREGACMLRAFREDVHRHLGYGAFAEYSDRHLGYGRRTTRDKLRTAEALERLPELAHALVEGRLHPSAVRELARVATRETETAWIDAAAGRRMRDIEQLVAGRARGDRPSDTPRPGLERHILRFEVGGETLAAFREAMNQVRKESGEPLDDDAALRLIARSVPCGAHSRANGTTAAASTPAAPETLREDATRNAGAARPKYQITIHVCERCQRGSQRAGADLVDITPALLETAQCDALIQDTARREDHTHVGAAAQSWRPRATLPPAVRRRILERDQHRCQILGCRHTLDVDVHHVKPRADGGDHDPANLLTLCSAHHRAVHRGRLLITGSAPQSLRIQHADGSPYGAPLDGANAHRSDLAEKVFRGLRWLGFKETEAKRAVAAALAELAHVQGAPARPPTADALLKRALALIGRPSPAPA